MSPVRGVPGESGIPEIPATSEYQAQRREAQQRHRALWEAHIEGGALSIPITPATYITVQRQEVQATKDFWAARGYRVRTQSNEDKTVLTVWLERKAKV